MSATATLEEAQRAKLARVRELLDLKGGERVLEIGCGWGALARHLAREAERSRHGHHACRPRNSPSPSKRSSSPSVKNKVDLRLQDYRDVEGQYDRVVSIEMFEAVGEAYWPSYFATLAPLAGGRRARGAAGDFDRRGSLRGLSARHRFHPGAHLSRRLPALQGDFRQGGRAGAGLAIAAAEHFGLSYAETLAEWRRRFNQNWSKIAPLGFDERFRRLWNYYLEYCEAGFREGAIDVGLYTLVPQEAAAMRALIASVMPGCWRASARRSPAPTARSALWARGDGIARVKIEPCGTDLCAINTWIKPGVTDEKVGDRLVLSLKADNGTHWAGRGLRSPTQSALQHVVRRRRRFHAIARLRARRPAFAKSMGWTRLSQD